jgi:hypothetical protein
VSGDEQGHTGEAPLVMDKWCAKCKRIVPIVDDLDDGVALLCGHEIPTEVSS